MTAQEALARVLETLRRVSYRRARPFPFLDPEDVAQEAALIFLRRWPLFPGEPTDRGLYLFARRAAANAVNQLRGKSARQLARLRRFWAARRATPRPPSRAATAPAVERLDRALARLDPTDRLILHARVIDERTTRDLGRELGMSGQAVSLRFVRATARVREALAC
jgi:RNA polymerase sigma factor (sigma-70 family)